jgi:hypothetical protein
MKFFYPDLGFRSNIPSCRLRNFIREGSAMGVSTRLIVFDDVSVVLASVTVFGQFWDDFSSGNFLSGGWEGDTGHFRFTSSSAIPSAMHPAIQLYTTGAGTSQIRVIGSWHSMMEWSAWYKLSFRPSANNFARFYLTGDTLHGEPSDSSLFVGIGMASRRVGIYRHEGSGCGSADRGHTFPP